MEKFCDHQIRNGDVIGVLLEFKESVDEGPKGTLSFFRNGGILGEGPAYKDIPAGEYFPCLSINYGRNTTMLNSNARTPSPPYAKAQKEENPSGGGGGGGGGGDEEGDYGEEREAEEGEEEME